ncbi:MAG: RHS repeat protein, partial [Alphaproteobacteria bacterium]|nr:RHS repeat protein [Alphaproteobacteria bacterium]
MRTTFPDGSYEGITAYDANDNVLTRRTRAGATLTSTYDALDRLVTYRMPRVSGGDLVTTTAYDLAGQVTGVGNSDGFALLYTYDAAGRQTSEAETIPGLSGTKTLSYQYDAGGNRTRLTWPDGWYVGYAYDALGRMVEAKESGTLLLASYAYDPLSRLTAQTAGNGGTRSLAYNLTGDLLSLAQGWSGGGVTYTQTYTAARQLSSLQLSNPAFAFAPPSSGSTIAYAPANALNQYQSLTPMGGGAVSLAYDANGNLTGDGRSCTRGYSPSRRRFFAPASAVMTPRSVRTSCSVRSARCHRLRRFFTIEGRLCGGWRNPAASSSP